MQSIVSYPNRDNWGKNTYRGNTTGHIIKDLLLQFQRNQFVEVFAGGSTGKDIVKELGVNSLYLDLNGNFVIHLMP